MGEIAIICPRSDWLRNPSRKTMLENLLAKCTRFMVIIAANSKKLAAPTLDVDMTRHTRRLIPRGYAATAVKKTGLPRRPPRQDR